MIKREKLFSLDDVSIIPTASSSVRHRGDINPYYKVGNKEYLPIFVSPMECVINEHNYDIYEKNGVIPIYPRTVDINTRLAELDSRKWVALSLSQFEDLFTKKTSRFVLKHRTNHYRVLIDMANGHIESIKDDIMNAKRLAKENSYDIEIMVGNIANPETYYDLSLAGADYVRISVGTGNCCITSSNTAVHYPMASLIDECRHLKDRYNLESKIIADGGISSYSRAIKALALGADYVMIGSAFGKCFESASEFIKFDKPSKEFTYYSIYTLNDARWLNMDEDKKKEIIKMYAPLVKTVWGMSTRRAQISIARADGKAENEITTKTSEGIEKEVTVDYTLHQWVENFRDYLRSSMSYCNCFNLESYIGKQTLQVLSEGAKSAINK